jgi:hypothetical protein
LKLAIRGLIAGLLLIASVAVVGLVSAGDAGGKGQPANKVLAQAVAVELGHAKVNPKSPFARVSGSTVNSALDRMGVIQRRLAKSKNRFKARYAHGGGGVYEISRSSEGCPNVFGGGGGRDGDDHDGGSVKNTRVNQDCGLRRQAEEWVGVNPRDFDNVLAGQNDSVIGFNHCGYDFSFNKGRTWGSVGTAPPPFWQFVLADGHTSDACSDPAGTFDHLGNAYATGVLFDIASPASAIPVVKSNWPNGGAFWHTAALQGNPWQEYSTSPLTGPASDNDANIFHDKELMVADSRASSPKKGRVYVTWTRFETNATPVGGRSPVVFSQSLDGGATWSRAVIISGAAGAFCTAFSGTPDSPNACDQDQGSHPVVGPDGTIYVIFGNGNTPIAGVNQVLMVRCPATNVCDKETDWQGPFRIGDLIGTHPIGDPGNVGGCPVGRQCLPPNGYRAPEFTGLSISADRNGNLYASWWDTRNLGPPCGPLIPWSTARPPCNSDVFYAYSTNGGTTWSASINVTARFAPTAQWQSWHDVSGDGRNLYIAYYDRHYGDCEFTGCNDITLTTVRNPRSAHPDISHRRITTRSMPNLVPANNPVQAGFLGDYMWVEVSHHNFNQNDVHIVWADTRPLPYRLSHQRFPEEDIYYARIEQGGGNHED